MYRFLYLHTHLMPYTEDFLNRLAERNVVSIDLVYYPIRASSPYKPELNENINVTNLHRLNKDYDFVYICGWSDFKYIQLAYKYKLRGSKIIISSDTILKFSVRKIITILIFNLGFKYLFDLAFVPGEKQRKYLSLLGLKNSQIKKSWYRVDGSNQSNPNTLLRAHFAGRLEVVKNILPVIEEVVRENLDGIEIHLYGEGSLKSDLLFLIKDRSNIHYHGFSSKNTINENVNLGDIFILPSIDEPWGVVVQEFAHRGCYLILSDKVNSSELFCVEGVNGVVCQNDNPQSFIDAIKSYSTQDYSKRELIGLKSVEIASRFSLDNQVDSFVESINIL